MSLRTSIWKVGLDLGASSTKLRRVSPDAGTRPRELTIPTVVAYPRLDGMGRDERPLAVGREALRSVEDIALVSPFELDGRERTRCLGDFIRALRRPDVTSWGVVVKDPLLAEHDLRAVTNDLFDRFLIVDAPLVAGRAILDGRSNRCAILVDVGARATRVYMLSGSVPLENERAIVDGGGNGIDARLAEALANQYPELVLTHETLSSVKETLGSVATATRRCELDLDFRGATRRIDVTDSLRHACEGLVDEVASGVESVLTACPSDYVEHFLENIYLFGGGASLRGLSGRLEARLHESGIDRACVRSTKSPRTVLVTGALKWALDRRNEADWGTPLFSYRSIDAEPAPAPVAVKAMEAPRSPDVIAENDAPEVEKTTTDARDAAAADERNEEREPVPVRYEGRRRLPASLRQSVGRPRALPRKWPHIEAGPAPTVTFQDDHRAAVIVVALVAIVALTLVVIGLVFTRPGFSVAPSSAAASPWSDTRRPTETHVEWERPRRPAEW